MNSNKKRNSPFPKPALNSSVAKSLAYGIGKNREKISVSIPYLNLVIAAATTNILLIGAVLILLKNLPPEIPLFYGLPESNEQLAQSSWLIVPAAISLTIIIINSTMAYLFKEEFIKKTLVLASVGTSVFVTIAIVKIIMLVGSF
jgi:hypothetical protein